MLMRHEWQVKEGKNVGEATMGAHQGLGQLGIPVVGKGDGWVLGEVTGGLILTQAMRMGDDGGDSYVIVVVAAEKESALVACNQLSDFIRGLRE